MPSPYSSLHHKWKHDIDKSPLTGKRFYRLYDFDSNRSVVEDNWQSWRGNDFLNGFLQGKTNTDGYVKHTTIKPSKFNATVVKKPFSGNDFLDGFASTQTKRDGFRQQTTKSSKSNDSSGCRTFLDEPRILIKYRSTGQSPPTKYTRKPSIASTQIIKDEILQQTAKSSKSNDSYGRRTFLDEQRCLRINSRSTNQSLSQFTRKPKTASIHKPSPSTYPKPKEQKKVKKTEAEWQEIEKKSQQEQKEFLEKYLKEGWFEEKSVSSEDKNVRRGDHLLYKGGSGGLYDHHLLCTKVDRNNIHIIEYTGQSVSFSASSRSVAESNLYAFAAIKQGTLTYKELEKKKAKIRKWPEELQRFPVDEVISRAELRLGKKECDYNVFDNNCEHFVNWCKCGLNTSLQVQRWHKPLWDSTKAVCSAAVNSLGGCVSKYFPTFFKAVDNVKDEILESFPGSLSVAGYVGVGAIEICLAARNIFKDYKRMKEDRLSKRQFNINFVGTVFKAVFHVSGMIAGSVIGSLVAGPLGNEVGGAIGYGVGHVAGLVVGLCYEYAPKIKEAIKKKVIAPVKKVVNTCVNAV